MKVALALFSVAVGASILCLLAALCAGLVVSFRRKRSRAFDRKWVATVYAPDGPCQRYVERVANEVLYDVAAEEDWRRSSEADALAEALRALAEAEQEVNEKAGGTCDPY